VAAHQRRCAAGANAVDVTLLPVHIIAGSIAIVAGFVSVFALKGAKLHRKSGMIFVYSMLVLSISGAVIAALKHQTPNVVGGSLAFYMVTTALLTVRPRDQRSRWIDAGALLIGATVGVFAMKIGFDAVNTTTGKINGVPAGMMFSLRLTGKQNDKQRTVGFASVQSEDRRRLLPTHVRVGDNRAGFS
jgi:uncharacterized membrane protein